jgi:menaquinone-dependent protoporphyrinogen oxidase
MGPILVAFASRMGATAEIAEAIGGRLELAGFAVDVLPCADRPLVANYDAAVIGSAVYLKRWEKAAKRLLRDQTADLAARPVWLFQSGPCGEDARTEQTAVQGKVARLAAQIGCLPPVTFGGRLSVETAMGPISKWMASGPPLAGDYRDFDRIHSWADAIGEELRIESEVNR